ncbi:MAG TPA: pitrilysin family protein [Xanthobacteraceae bacterium]|nr:pitrilysin family protein [Xanthobacteraceae bacterium]
MPKSLIRILSVIGLLAALATLAARDARAASAVTQFSLANGVEVVVIPDHRTAVVTHMIWYRAGAADEPLGKSGIAHFLEHLMFKGTAKNPAGRFSQQLAAIGGQENAFTTNDYTAYYQRTSRDHLATLMDFEADRMTGLVLTDGVIASERQVILEERNMRVDNEPSARLSEQMGAMQYLNHPYHHPTIGWRHEMESLDRTDALAFYHRFYSPENAVVVIAGDVSPEEVKTFAENTYGKIPRHGPTIERKRPQEPPQIAERRVTFADPRVTQPSLQRTYLVPSFTTAKGDDGYALDVLAHILGGGSNSRLNRALEMEQRLATGIGAWYQGTSLDDSRFGFYGTPASGVSLDKLEAAIDGVIAAFIEQGPSAEELERSKSRMIADYVYAQDNQSTLARMYGAALTSGETVADIQQRPAKLKAVTAEQVRDVARRFLDKRRSVTGYLVRDNGGREEKKS